jgi:hypothetical protein
VADERNRLPLDKQSSSVAASAGASLLCGISWMSTPTIMTLLPIPLTQLGALLNAVGMLLTGFLVIKAGIWKGWVRWTPLAVGLYPLSCHVPNPDIVWPATKHNYWLMGHRVAGAGLSYCKVVYPAAAVTSLTGQANPLDSMLAHYSGST